MEGGEDPLPFTGIPLSCVPLSGGRMTILPAFLLPSRFWPRGRPRRSTSWPCSMEDESQQRGHMAPLPRPPARHLQGARPPSCAADKVDRKGTGCPRSRLAPPICKSNLSDISAV